MLARSLRFADGLPGRINRQVADCGLGGRDLCTLALPVACLGAFHLSAQRLHPSAQRQSARLEWGDPYVSVQAGPEVPEAVISAAQSDGERDTGERRATGPAPARSADVRTVGTRVRWPYRWIPQAEADRLRPVARDLLPELLA